MTKSKKEKTGPIQSVLTEMGELLQKTASAMEEKKKVPAQLAELSNRLKGVGPKIKKLDENATSKWMDCISENANMASIILSHFEKQKVDILNVRLEVVDALIDATENVSEILVELASGLMVPKSVELKDKHIEEIRAKSLPVKRAMNKLAADLYASSFGLRVFSGLDPDENSGFKSVIKTCKCCGDEDSKSMEEPIHLLNLESGIGTTVGGQGEDLNEYTSAINNDFEKLKDVIMLLALYILWLASQGYLTTNAGGYPCDDDCTPGPNVVGTTVTNVTAPPVPTTTRSFQPQCNVNWDFCCTNICLIFYEENFIVTVQTGPHKLGAQVRLIVGQNAKTAQVVANRRAARFRPINSLTPPAKPSC